MLKNNFKNNSAFFLPAFTVGIQDGINPCELASALVFVLYLSRVGYTQKHIFALGLLYVLSSLLTHYGLTLGLFDALVTSSAVIELIRGIYFLLGAGFILFGMVNVWDRIRYEKYFNPHLFKCAIPVFLKDFQQDPKAKKKGFFSLLGMVIFSIGAGAFLSLLSAIYPQQEYIYIVHSYYLSGGNELFARASFIQYSIASAFPQLIAWFVVLALGGARDQRRVILYYKSMSAALFLSVGIGLGYFLLR